VLTRTYLLADVPPRAVSIALSVLFLAAVPVLLYRARQLLESKHFLTFLYVWDGLGIAATVVWVVLDGGGSSPYVAFFYVLVGHAALAFPPRGTVAAGLSVVLARLATGLLDAQGPVVDTVIDVVALALLATVATLMARGQQALVGRARTLTDQAIRLADVDGLTGCINHRAFHARLAEESAKATSGHPLSVLVLDVDYFKAINDGYGHQAGDDVLSQLGSLLRAGFRAHDVVGRIGGDEFAVLLPDADQETAAGLERRLLEALNEGALPHRWRVTIVSATTSVAADGTELLGSADARLYAKRRYDRTPE
jgi:diguanylate cyclase (GGDEF)-like protein